MPEATNQHKLVEIAVMTCPSQGCGIVYGLTEDYRATRQKDGTGWYCPNGHHLSYHQANKTEAQQLRERLEECEEQRREDVLMATYERDYLVRKLRAERSAKSRIRNERDRLKQGGEGVAPADL